MVGFCVQYIRLPEHRYTAKASNKKEMYKETITRRWLESQRLYM